MEIDELDQIKQDVAKAHEETIKQNPVFSDKILNEIMEKNVYISEFTQFPRAVVGMKASSGLVFEHYLNHKSIRNINETRTDYFTQRLAQAEERVLSHVKIYMKAKLTQSESDKDFKIV